MALLWFGYAALLELTSIPFLFLEQNDPGFVAVGIGGVTLTIIFMAAHPLIEKRHRV